MSSKLMPREVRLFLFLVAVLSSVCGCPTDIPSNQATITDGTMIGIGGRRIRADIDVEPNVGTFGTPVSVTITFTEGGSQVSEIETWQAVAESGWEFNRTGFDAFGFPLDPFQITSTRWVTSGLGLTGIPGIVRYYALDSFGTRIALGDIDLNGGQP